MRQIDRQFWIDAVDSLVEAFATAEVRLCGLDGAIGDGDHGTSMLFGLREAQSRLRASPPPTAGGVLGCLGDSFLDTVGGVTGIVFGSMFSAAAGAAGPDAALDASWLHRAFAAGLTAVKERGKAAEGDKSMLDALAPAVRALRAASEDGLNPAESLAAAARAAEDGRDATGGMEARVGRARSQPARGRGHVDAGAASVALLFQTLSGCAGASGSA